MAGEDLKNQPQTDDHDHDGEHDWVDEPENVLNLEDMKDLKKHGDLEQQKLDLTKFILDMKKLSNSELREFQQKLAGWKNTRDTNQLRTAGLTKEQNRQDRMKKHILLSSAFLKDVPDSKGLQFQVDFGGNTLAERKIGAGDLLPPEIEAIEVRDQSNRIISKKAIRGTTGMGRVSYIDADTGKYVPIFTGFKIAILETGSEADGLLKGRIAREEQVFNRHSDIVPEYHLEKLHNHGEKIDRGFWRDVVGNSPDEVEPHLDHNVTFLGKHISSGVNELLVPYLAEAEERIKAAGINYKVRTIGGESWRNVKGSNNLSFHSWGAAIDINARENPMGDHLVTDMPDNFVQIMKDCGFRWGGDFSRPDAMHFDLLANPLDSKHLLKTERAQKLAVEIIDKVKIK